MEKDTLHENYGKTGLVLDPNSGFGRNKKADPIKSREQRLEEDGATYSDDDGAPPASAVRRRSCLPPPPPPPPTRQQQPQSPPLLAPGSARLGRRHARRSGPQRPAAPH